MKYLIAIGFMTIIFIAGCVKNESTSDNITKIEENVTNSMKMDFRIEIAKSTPPDKVSVGLRNTGFVDIDLSEIKVYVAEEIKNAEGNAAILKPGATIQFNVTNVTSSCNKILKIILSSGMEDFAPIRC